MQSNSCATTSEAKVGIIVLAAGASTRMGELKQLLRYEGETLLRRAIVAACASHCRPVIVVLGSHEYALRDEIAGMDVLSVVNREWAEGMSSSIRCGITALEKATGGTMAGAVLMLCDQPFVTGDSINRLVESYLTGSSVLVASDYQANGERTHGVPSLFGRALFAELMNLRGNAGAKSVIKRHLNNATVVAMPEAAFDIDTPQDYRSLLGNVADYSLSQH